MSEQAPLIKRHNHKIHPCPTEKKRELLQQLLEQNKEINILVISTQSLKSAQNSESITYVEDVSLPETKYELIISLDLPQDPEVYAARLECTTSKALILLDVAEKQALYAIEKLLARTINQENIEGFSPNTGIKSQRVKREERAKKIADGTIRDNRPDRIREKKASGENRKGSKFVGKDENGKPVFSGKTGDRNHKYDGAPKKRDDKKQFSKKSDNPAKKNSPKRAPRKVSLGSIKPTEVVPSNDTE